jgi:hypothetical protein
MLRGFNPQAAVDAPRFCISTGTPDATVRNEGQTGAINSEVYLEEGISFDTVERLKGKRLWTDIQVAPNSRCGYQPWDTMPAFSQGSQGICSGVDR